MKKCLGLLAALLAIVMLSTTIPVSAGTLTQSSRDIVSMRTENSKTYYVGENEYRIEVFAESVHYKEDYKDDKEEWKDIDLTWENNSITKAPYTLTFDPYTFSVIMVDRRTSDEAVLRLDSLGGKSFSKPEMSVSGSALRFSGVSYGIDLEITARSESVQYKRIIKSSLASLDATFSLILSGDGIAMTTGARYQSGGLESPTVNAYYSDGVLTETVSKSSVVRYPVEIDPTLTVQPAGKDTCIQTSTPTTNYDTLDWVGVEGSTSNVLRSLLEFDISGIPAGSYITSAALNLYKFGYIVNDPVGRTYYVYQLLRRDFVDSEATWNIYKSGSNWTTAGAGSNGNDYTTTDGVSQTVPADGNWMVWTVTDQVDTAFAGGYTADFRVSDSVENSGTRYIAKFASTEYATSTYRPKLIVNYVETLTVTTDAADDLEDTTATLNGTVTGDGGGIIDYYGFVWDTVADAGDPGNVDPSGPPAGWEYGWKSGSGNYGENPFDHAIDSLPTGTTIYFRATAHNEAGWEYGDSASFLTKPAAPTNVAATDGDHTDKVVVTWTKSTGATGYKVYEGINLLDTLGDVATYDDAAAPAGTITPGTADATDGTHSDKVVLSVAGESASPGASRTYKVVAFNGTGDSDDSTTDTGYRGIGAISYQWLRSADDSDADYANIDGATTDPYDDVAGVIEPDGRYYKATLSATGAANQDTTVDRGYRSAIPPFFTVTYVNDQQIDISWNIVGGADRFMVRGKYGEYPTDETDGYLVYFGNGLSVSDTSMNLDLFVDRLYYRGYAVSPLDVYSLQGEDFVEGKGMTLLFFGIIPLFLTVSMFRTRNSLLGFPCLMFWAILGGYCYQQSLTTWDMQYFMFFACMGMAIFTGYAAFSLNKKDLSGPDADKGAFIDEGGRRNPRRTSPAAAAASAGNTEGDDFSMDTGVSGRVAALRKRADDRRSGNIRRKSPFS